jgi:hypothetical protein
MVNYCGDWNLKCNLKKTKILVFKKGGKLQKNDKLFMHDQLIEVVNEINYLGITLESAGGWNSRRMKQMVKGNHSLVAIDICLTRTPDMRIQLL